MEHEFVPGKRRCQSCRMKLNEAAWLDADAGTPLGCPGEIVSPKSEPEPEKPPQVWHLNVWTSVNGVIFTGSHQYSGPDVLGWAQAEAVNKVKEIVAGYTAKEETE